jgi:hypothetical protein
MTLKIVLEILLIPVMFLIIIYFIDLSSVDITFKDIAHDEFDNKYRLDTQLLNSLESNHFLFLDKYLLVITDEGGNNSEFGCLVYSNKHITVQIDISEKEQSAILYTFLSAGHILQTSNETKGNIQPPFPKLFQQYFPGESFSNLLIRHDNSINYLLDIGLSYSNNLTNSSTKYYQDFQKRKFNTFGNNSYFKAYIFKITRKYRYYLKRIEEQNIIIMKET